jgi:endonuclease/exonuclease/phosphatase (EEP) superfamily protein YafD
VLRERQAAKLNELYAKAVHPMILAGDLNATPDSAAFRSLAGIWNVATAGPALLTYPSAKPTKQIDYVLYRPAGWLRATAAAVIDEPVASDHRPVVAVFELIPASPAR